MKKAIILSIFAQILFFSNLYNSKSQTWQEMVDSSKFYQYKQDFQSAMKWAKSALPQAEQEFGQLDTNYANTINSIGEIFYYTGKFDSCSYYWNMCIKIEKNIHKEDHPDVANSLNNLAALYHSQGKLNDAEPLCREALEMNRRLYKSDNPDLANSINGLAALFLAQGKLIEAEPLFKEALQMKRRLFKGDNPYVATSLGWLAYVYQSLGKLNDAELLFQEALDMKRRLFKNDNTELAGSLNNLAYIFKAQGRMNEAEPLFKESLDMFRRIIKNDHPFIATTLNNIAIIYQSQGRFNEAEVLFKEALEMKRRLFKGDNPDVAGSLNNLAGLYQIQGKLNEAEPLCKQTLEMNRRIYKNDHPELAGSIINMATFYNISGNYNQAEILFKEALEMFRRIYKNDHPDLATCINNIADFYNNSGDYKQSEILYKEAIEMYRRIFKSNHPDLAWSAFCMAGLYNNLKKYSQSESLFNESLEYYKNILNNYFPSLSENEKKLYWNIISNNFEAYSSFAIQRSLENPMILCNMYDMQLYTKALLFNSTNKIKKRILNSNDSILINKYKELNNLKELIVKLYTMTEEVRIKNGYNLDSIEKLNNDLEKELSLKSESYIQNYEKNKITWKSIQTLLKPDEAAVEVVRLRYKEKNKFTDSIYYAFLIISKNIKEHPDLVILENGNSLENQYFKGYRSMIKYQIQDTSSYGNYWSKLYNKIKNFKKIYFAPDGIYNKLNPETFLMPNGKYLIDEQEIQEVNSTKDLILGILQNKKDDNLNNKAVLIGNPNFSLSESQVREVTNKITGKSDETKNYVQIASTRGIELNRLPGTEKEIKDIEEYLKSKNLEVESYLGDMALKTVVKSVNNPRILHIATHGMFLEDVKSDKNEFFGIDKKKLIENPLLRSGLFFTGADNYLKSDSTKQTDDENGILTAYEAMNLDLDNTELVVLSACETGLGEVRNGEGVFGLRRAFQQAGAKTTVMSLWSVNDESTQDLMSNFYKNWVSGITKREAFSRAQQEVRNKYPDPYYWGAFVMVGE